MCGIVGYSGKNENDLLKKMGKMILHRGPDGEGIFQNEFVSLLNRRLAIVDLAGGQQPFFDESRNVAVVYNGEIYNYQKIKDSLKIKGCSFKTNCDSEIIPHAWEKWGEKCFDKFDGMFAIAIYDKKTSKLILAIDQFGIKPIYYAIDKDGDIVFGSEIKPILLSKKINKEVNENMVYRYLVKALKDGNKETFFDGIYKLMPGEMLIFDINTKKLELKKYSNLYNDLKKSKINQTKPKAIFDILEKSIKDRLMSDVDLGVSVSGGIDSTIIARLTSKFIKKNQKLLGFSLVFPGEKNDEEQYIDEVIKSEPKLLIEKIKPNSRDFSTDAIEFITTLEEPTIDNSSYSHYQLFQAVSKKVKVLLDGQGADEIFAGYEGYLFIYLKQLVKEKNILKIIQLFFQFFPIWIKLLFEKTNHLKSKQQNIFEDHFLEKHINDKNPTLASDSLKDRLVDDIFLFSLQASLRNLDKNSMHFSVKARPPFINKFMIEKAFNLKSEDLINNGHFKAVLKNYYKNLLTNNIFNRRKIGFSIPFEAWLWEKRDWIRSLLIDQKEKLASYIDINSLEKLIIDDKYYQNIDRFLLWRLFNLALWLKVFID